MSDASLRRWAGRRRTEAKTVWVIVVRGVYFRCLVMDDGNKVEIRSPIDDKWKKLHYSARHPLQLLRQVVDGRGMDQLFEEE